ncbi:hypothetical protein OMAG_001783 [Candidatus Omnitrophus magneticus]|uniref:Uncharacterized protein n=1 Tax=Candidatus Omnitrophus magneticus TaxID=1609969 RepID=A0A0F0CSA2_9BACT|nr:hypothetical protein OMAG_001783 [Candidatus Omnitrophus magneticus]
MIILQLFLLIAVIAATFWGVDYYKKNLSKLSSMAWTSFAQEKGYEYNNGSITGVFHGFSFVIEKTRNQSYNKIGDKGTGDVATSIIFKIRIYQKDCKFI